MGKLMPVLRAMRSIVWRLFSNEVSLNVVFSRAFKAGLASGIKVIQEYT
jgi:hypothetical protein